MACRRCSTSASPSCSSRRRLADATRDARVSRAADAELRQPGAAARPARDHRVRRLRAGRAGLRGRDRRAAVRHVREDARRGPRDRARDRAVASERRDARRVRGRRARLRPRPPERRPRRDRAQGDEQGSPIGATDRRGSWPTIWSAFSRARRSWRASRRSATCCGGSPARHKAVVSIAAAAIVAILGALGVACGSGRSPCASRRGPSSGSATSASSPTRSSSRSTMRSRRWLARRRCGETIVNEALAYLERLEQESGGDESLQLELSRPIGRLASSRATRIPPTWASGTKP